MPAPLHRIVVYETCGPPPETVWRALTEAELIGRWLLPPTGFRPVGGQRFTFHAGGAGAWAGAIHCQIVDLLPNRRLAYTWQSGHEASVGEGARVDTLVTWTLSRRHDGARVGLAHAGFVLPGHEAAFAAFAEAWPHVVRRLTEVAAGLGPAMAGPAQAPPPSRRSTDPEA